MKTDFKASFLRDVKKIVDNGLKERIREAIKNVEAANYIKDIANLKKLSGYKTYYRIKISDYRVGLNIESSQATFVTFAHRKDIYRKFPPK